MTPVLAIAISFGLFLRAMYMSILDCKKTDSQTIVLSILIGLLVAARIGDADPVFWAMLPLFVSGVLAFGYKDRLLLPISEAVVVFYGLLGLYLFSEYLIRQEAYGRIFDGSSIFWTAGFLFVFSLSAFLISKINLKLCLIMSTIFLAVSLPVMVAFRFLETFLITASFLFISVYLLIALLVVVTSYRLSHVLQTVMMWLFIAMSSVLSVLVGYSSVTTAMSKPEAVLLGFVCLPFLAGVFYLVYFIPVPLRKRETIAMRLQDIQGHARDLAAKYHDEDISFQQLLITVLVFGLFVILDVFSLVADPLLLSIVITMILYTTAPKVLSDFTPRHIHDRR